MPSQRGLDPALLEALRRFDTPTLCNALERVAPARQGHGFTREPLVCAHPTLAPVVGFARTARVRSAIPSDRAPDAERAVVIAYYRHVAAPPHPTVTVIEDVDRPPVGAWWGEVNSHLHRGLGSLGAITNGIARDLPQLAEGFQVLASGVGPSHAHVHVLDVAVPVTVAGMAVAPGDLIHADRHGAVVIPPDAAAALPAAAERVIEEERVLIEAAKKPGFDVELLERILGGRGH